MRILEIARRLLDDHPLCDRCLGRQFALLVRGSDNEYRGRAIKLLLTAEAHRIFLEEDEKAGVVMLSKIAANGFFEPALETLSNTGTSIQPSAEKCSLCDNVLQDMKGLIELVHERVQDVDFNDFLVGVMVPSEVINREDALRSAFGIPWGESIKNEFSREIGKAVSALSGKEVNYKSPDLVVIVNPFKREVSLQGNPLFIYGQYKKLLRGFPQAKWVCRECGGSGCSKCSGSGKLYPFSVEELITEPVLELTGGEDANFHAAGREDVDVRMLGTGRPFIVEVKKPKRRSIDLKELEERVNHGSSGKVEVSNLSFSSKASVRRLKAREDAEKTYIALVKFEKPVADESLELIRRKLMRCVVYQLTPTRVLHRKPDRSREKYIYDVSVERMAPDTVSLRIKCQGGLYVKELINGDQGRTTPNLTDMTGIKAACVELDVVGVCLEGLHEEV